MRLKVDLNEGRCGEKLKALDKRCTVICFCFVFLGVSACDAELQATTPSALPMMVHHAVCLGAYR